ncbi:MAG: proline racemase family protein [Planctomycetes bacterium]|nr:proline racemase family protein [Planctomycetota bacterium]
MHSNWQPPSQWLTLTTLDAHTAGEPLRLYTGSMGNIPGATVLEKRRYLQENLDYLRTGLMFEPRGHADMYGAILTEPETYDGDFGVIFLHNQGYSTMCGHAIIALTTMIFDTGIINKPGDSPVLNFDAPAGRIVATAHRQNGKVKTVSFLNVPSFVYRLNETVEVDGIGRIQYDVAFGGAFYAFCDARALKLDLTSQNYNRLIDIGRRIKNAVNANLEIKHPLEEDLGFLYGTIFVGSAENPAHHSRNVCIFAEGELDRSPTGTGVSARCALHHAKGELAVDEPFTVESILGTCFTGRVVEVTTYGPYQAVIPEVTGSASIVGQSQFYFDPDDPLKNGFIFR